MAYAQTPILKFMVASLSDVLLFVSITSVTQRVAVMPEHVYHDVCKTIGVRGLSFFHLVYCSGVLGREVRQTFSAKAPLLRQYLDGMLQGASFAQSLRCFFAFILEMLKFGDFLLLRFCIS